MRLTTKQFCRVTGVPLGSTKMLREVIGVEPDNGIIRGLNDQEPYSLPNAVAGALWRGIRKMGVRPADAAAVARNIWRMSFEELEARLQSGKRLILVIGPIACPFLLSEEAVKFPEGIPPELAASLQPVAVDVQKLLTGIVAEVQKEAKATAGT